MAPVAKERDRVHSRPMLVVEDLCTHAASPSSGNPVHSGGYNRVHGETCQGSKKCVMHHIEGFHNCRNGPDTGTHPSPLRSNKGVK